MNSLSHGGRRGVGVLWLFLLGAIVPSSGCTLGHTPEDTAAPPPRTMGQQPPPLAVPPGPSPRALSALPPYAQAQADGRRMIVPNEQDPPRLRNVQAAPPWSGIPDPPQQLRGPLLAPAGLESRLAARPARRSVIHADGTTFDQQVLGSNEPVLVDFYAPWCGPCRALAPTLVELAAETPQARVVKVDIDANPQLANRFGVTSIPSLMVFKGGRVVARQTGLVSKSRLKAMLDR